MSEMLECTIQPRTEKDKAYLVVACRLGFKGQCKFPCWTNPASHIMWHWDGALTFPTISPSINCLKEGCGRHFIVTRGIGS